ncbi:MAG: TetR/AcrR family transcriptional regulator [Planctomycetes bacterium]|nr:TetR/AcrR family transcriptional regulator [Planctomycetota bacterium]
MARPSLIAEKRRSLAPIVARVFAELGYRRTTTAELAKRCRVRENILYRLWPDKKAMFIAAIRYVHDLSIETWTRLLDQRSNGRTGAETLLDYESSHHGEFKHYRIIFAGLSETDDPEIRAALADMYQRYQRFVQKQVSTHQSERRLRPQADAAMAAWALVGLGTVASIGRELDLLNERQRRKFFAEMGTLLLGGLSD